MSIRLSAVLLASFLFSPVLVSAQADGPRHRNERGRPRPLMLLQRMTREIEKGGVKTEQLLTELKILGDLYGESVDLDELKEKRTQVRTHLIIARRKIEGGAKMYARLLDHLKDNSPSGHDNFKPFERTLERVSHLVDYIDETLESDARRFKAVMREREDQPIKKMPAPWAEPEPPIRRESSPVGFLIIAALVLLGFFVVFLLLARKFIRSSVREAAKSLATPPRDPPPAGDPMSLPAGPAQGAVARGPEGPGQVIGGNFEIEKILGKGGMGIVYLAKDLTLGRRVAIKRMREEVVENEYELKAFLQEAKLVASLKHPNLVEIYSIVKEPNRLYLVFELVEGRTLQQVIDANKKLTVAQAKSILYQVASALDYAHENRIIHRDLKPANIMITAGGVAKVMDFGLAHQTQKTVAKVTQTEISGTPPYMAPEQEMGSTSRATDVFSLGVCLYQMLTGELPFNGPNFLAQKREMAFTPVTQAVAGLPSSLDNVIQTALESDPGKRYGSAGELSKSLQMV